MIELLLKEEVYAVMGAAMEVYKELGYGFLEPVYQEALDIELCECGIPYEPQKPLELRYKAHLLEKKYVPDFVCFGQVIVELKALDRLSTREDAQVLNYLKATGYRVGVLVNFGARDGLQWKRLVR